MDSSLRLLSKLTALSLTLTATGCVQSSSPPAETADVAQVVATHSVLCDLTQQIAQTTVDVTCLMDSGEDPHVYSATPSDRRALEAADLVFYGGYGFEPEIIQMITASDTSAPKIAVSETAVPAPLLGDSHDHSEDHSEDHDKDHGEDHQGHDEDHSENHSEDHSEDHHDHDEDHSENHHAGDNKPIEDETLAPDPHVWHDANHGVAMVEVIQVQLAKLSPEHADLYEKNATAMTDQLAQLDDWIQTQVNTIPASGRTLISTHGALGYYADAYGLEIESALGSVSTEAGASAETIRDLTELVKAKGVSSIFVESTSNPGVMETISRETEINVSDAPIYADGLGDADTPAATYQGMLTTNTCTIVNGLGGNCDPTTAPAAR